MSDSHDKSDTDLSQSSDHKHHPKIINEGEIENDKSNIGILSKKRIKQMGLEATKNQSLITKSFKKIKHWPLLPIFILSMASILASFSFYTQGEADHLSPILVGLGLWMLWRMPNTHWIRLYFGSIYVALFMIFLIERAQSHSVFREVDWQMSEFSWNLYISTFLLGLSWIISIIYRKW
jgi:hypothetical protein